MKKILIVNANYYDDITGKLVVAATKILKRKSFKIDKINVPGAFEIPIAIRKNIKKYDAFLALGCVIKGKTPHFNLICNSTFYAISKISIIYNKPVGNGIITALNFKQAKQRCGDTKSNKGREAANAIISILKNATKKI